MAALSKLLLQMVTHLHADSHVKPRRVKMRMQMRAGRKEHKNNRCRHSVFCSCVGHESIRREAAVSLKRQELSNTKKLLASDCEFLQSRDAVATLPDTISKQKA